MRGRCPVEENICSRVSTSLTGRPTSLAATAHSATCIHRKLFEPNAPPTRGDETRTLSSGICRYAANAVRSPAIQRVLSCTVSWSPDHAATVADNSIG